MSKMTIIFLDENNEIILVGNPNIHESISDLYIEVINEFKKEKLKEPKLN